MKKIASIAAAFVLAGINMPANAQLPPTNMGKFVHQPGDNQYNVQTQVERHGTSYIDRTGPGGSVMVGKSGGGGGPIPGMAPMVVNPMILMGGTKPKVDISIEPISADEPVPPPGFPPLPERLQLPVAIGGSGGSGSGSWSGGGGGGGGAGGSGGGGGGGGGFQGMHQHYAHVKPGAYQGGGGGGGGGPEYSGAGDAAVPGVSGGGGGAPIVNPAPKGIGYYKAVTVPPPTVDRGGGGAGDTFNSGGAPGAPNYAGASSSDLKRLGRAPKLDDTQDAATAPEAPQAAVVTQSTTQDLSLPDDEFVSRYGLKDTGGKRAAKFMGQKMGQAGYRVLNRATGLIGF